MIAWLNPAALFALAAVAGPVIIHLMRQRHARRVMFPSLRFIQPSRSVASRLRRLSDPWLLLLRAAAISAAVVAAAQPVVITPGRLQAWNARTARAVVLDTSDSMRMNGAGAEARDAADGEAASAHASTVIEAAELQDGIRRATRWLATAPPARRELVVISDFHVAALTTAQLSDIPGGTGFRVRQVASGPSERTITGPRLAGSGKTLSARLTPGATAPVLVDGTPSPGGLRFEGITAAESGRLLRIVAAAGTPAPDPSQPIAIRFNSAAEAGLEGGLRGWMRPAVIRLALDGDLLTATNNIDIPAGATHEQRGVVILEDRSGRPILRAAARGDEMLLDAAVDPNSYAGAAVVRAALSARQPVAAPEQEILRVTAPELAAWSRPADPVSREVGVHAAPGDARWFWALALALLAAESLVRRRTPSHVHETSANAA